MNCKDQSTAPQTTINMQPFIKMAKTAVCADQSNNLYSIDDSLVFWRREGKNCYDNSYDYTLFGSDTGAIYCRRHDGFAYVEIINDSNLIDFFHTIIANLNDAHLGVGASHSIIQVKF
jgi:hypothetical protein